MTNKTEQQEMKGGTYRMIDEKTSSTEPYENVDWYAWEGARWEGEKHFPFATGGVCAVRMEPYDERGEKLFPVKTDLVTYHTEKIGRLFPYEIYERVEGQNQRRCVGKAMTAWGARRKIAKRASELTDLVIGQILMDKYRQGDTR